MNRGCPRDFETAQKNNSLFINAHYLLNPRLIVKSTNNTVPPLKKSRELQRGTSIITNVLNLKAVQKDYGR